MKKYKGKGEVKTNKKGEWIGTELITINDTAIGTVVNNVNGVEKKTSVFKIHYSKSGVHIVPDYPSKKK